MTTHRNARSIVFAALLASASVLETASATTVYLNEVRVHGDEAVELYNPGPEPVNVGGWSIVGTDGVYDIPEGASIAADGYLWLNGIGDIMSDLGGETSVIDLTINDVKDRLYYGLDGTAPLPPWSPSATIARAPDASIAPPPQPDPETDGDVWAIALNPTPGAMNLSRVPVLGTSLRILDVVLSASASSPTTILLENPAGHPPLYLGGWYVTAGAGELVHVPPYTIPSGTIAHLNVPSTFDARSTGLVYLHAMDGTRVDQTGVDAGADARELPAIDATWGGVKAIFR